ncbi:ferritin-like domain-containing protein (plasmid) [Nostoc sp. UHCC 0926]|uniref:ferritin-like domain-containing protein n=1 Tax=Nostoc sp. UHCC 0926 TaxID=3025190 RepID=UPI00235FCE45|nr:ferritin-like domain-containing protein [Nostoc sp. UHCC 0926]WDD30157.1 ferritin-like domain-containing protein [Nostoc sp. UHCC 0926]
MSEKIFPRNLTARADRQVVGNPATTRLESGVGNCYPGLEFDQRNLDRRFFAGLVFEFVSESDNPNPDASRGGALLLGLELSDPELNPAFHAGNPELIAAATQLRTALGGESGNTLSTGRWYLDSLEQGGKQISLFQIGEDDKKVVPLDGLIVWRLVRSLEPGLVKIKLWRRDAPSDSNPPATSEIELSGWRRVFVDSQSGVIGQVYQAGELTQSLCSPWQHDFRDCACFYWASNHPDIVLGEDTLGESTLPSGASADPERANTPIDWLRSDRSLASRAGALGNPRENRPFQMDHYEISQRWQELAVVLRGKEISQIYRAPTADTANPYKSPEVLAAKLYDLAGLEHVLCLEYLYALYSLVAPEEVDVNTWPTLRDDLTFVSHELLLVAVSEMRHLRWVNQLLWELDHTGLTKKAYGPALEVAERIPVGNGHTRPRQLRPLNRKTLADFIAVEAPSGGIDGQYARVVATLRQPQYPNSLYQLAGRIIADGVEHFSKFSEIETVLRAYQGAPQGNGTKPPYLRNVTPAPSDNPDAKQALDAYQRLLNYLEAAYKKGDMEDANNIVFARQEMINLQVIAQKLATQGFGIPFFDAHLNEVDD